MSGVRILAPAKINLGLAILGKRLDGYHEIDTIMAMLDLSDDFTLHESKSPGISISGINAVPVESNLITKAIRRWCGRTGQEPAFHVNIEKRIPSPAGLGGGSSNAAAAIRGLDFLFPNLLTPETMHVLAASIGADCPFFLESATARATGIGTELEPIPSPTGSVVIVVPPTNVAAKTATLYGALKPDDYGTREQVDAIRCALETDMEPSLKNSFTRAALEAFPGTRNAWATLKNVAGSCALSGAGPGVFALADEPDMADSWAAKLRDVLPSDFYIASTQFIDQPPTPEAIS